MTARNSRPPRIWVCTVAANDRNAGKLLSWIAGIARHATQRRRGYQGLWNANSREYILAQTALTLKQYKRARPILIDFGLAEFLDGGFAGKRVILTRPTRTFMRILEGAIARSRAREMIAERVQPRDRSGDQPGDQSNTLCSRCTPAPPLSAPGGEGNRGGGREGRNGTDRQPASGPLAALAPSPTPDRLAAGGAAAPPTLPSARTPANGAAAQGSHDPAVRPGISVRANSADRYLRRRDAQRAADAALVEQVRAVQDNPDLAPQAIRGALLRLLPELLPAAPKVVHPSKLPGGDCWHLHSPENIVMQYTRYTNCHANAASAHGVRRSASRFVPMPPLADEDLTPAARAARAFFRILDRHQLAGPEARAAAQEDRARVAELRGQGLDAPAIATSLGLTEEQAALDEIRQAYGAP
jgi:hypothetical protein